jgi:subtilisin family serine protease
VAVSGPLVRDPVHFAIALTDWAANYQVGGRALVPGDDTSSSLAVLLSLKSPFIDGPAQDSDLLAWLSAAIAEKPDILVLDYGAEELGGSHLDAVREAAESSLVIAAAGNTGGRVTYPARIQEVLAIGALASSNEIASYSALEPRRQKPDLFAPETLEGTPLQRWLGQRESTDETPMRGTSMAAYQAAAAAIVVWATNPEHDAGWVRAVLQETAIDLPSKYRRFRPRALNVPTALNRAREDLVVDTLRVLGRSSLPELLAGVGLPGSLADATLNRLVEGGRVNRSRRGSTESYETEG